MQEKSFAERFVSVSLGHKLIAVVAAVGIAVGGHLFLQRRAVMNASAAELSYDAHSAISIDPGLASAHDPAVALADSVLTDAKVNQLAASAPTAASSITGRLGEFRSNLHLSQPSANMLEVRYFASGDELSYEAANTVARALAQAGFSRDGAPVDAAPAPAPAVPAPKAHKAAAPAPGKPATQPNPNSAALSASLGELETMLSSTRRNLDNVGGSHGGVSRARHRGASSRRESDQQHLIKAGVAASERKMNAIRTSPAARNLTGAASGQLAEMQHAIAAILSGGGGSGFRSVGVSAAQIRRERAQLDESIATVHRGRMALQQEGSAPSEAQDNSAPAAASDNSTPASSSGGSLTTTDLNPSGQPVPGSGQSAPAQNPVQSSDQSSSPNDSGDLLTNPFTLVRSATTATPFPWWITLAAGLGFGLLYWIFAAVPSQEVSYDMFDTPEPSHTGNNLITPSFSYAPREEREPTPRITPDYAPAERSLGHDDDERRPRRASFRFEQASPEPAAFAPVAEPPQPFSSEGAAAAEELSPTARDFELAPEAPPPAATAAAPASEPASLPEAHFLTFDDLRRRFATAGKAAPEPSRGQDSSGHSPFDRLAG